MDELLEVGGARQQTVRVRVGVRDIQAGGLILVRTSANE